MVAKQRLDEMHRTEAMRILMRPFRSADSFPDFPSYAWHVTITYGMGACLCGPALLAMWWFTDPLVFPGSTQVRSLAEWRAVMIVMGLVGFALLYWLRPHRRAAFAVLVTLYLFMCVFSYSRFSRIGGPGTPWIHTSCLMPLPSLLCLIGVVPRALLVISVCVVTMVAYYLPHPEYLQDPYFWNALALLATSGMVGIIFGHVLYRLSEWNFLQAQLLLKLAAFDTLTGASRRGRFFEFASREVSRTRRHGRSLSVLMVDVDRFKQINDTHGHLAGDAVLATIARRFAEVLRESDLLARMGGEEFAVLLPETGLERAVEVAERLRKGVSSADIEHGGQSLRVTVSIGCAHFRPGEDADIGATLARADEALYAAKQDGRDRVRTAADEAASPPGAVAADE